MSLIDIFIAPRQQKLLAPLLLHPEQSFGTLELIRQSGAGIGAGQAQLKKLIEAGVVVVAEVGNQKRITINQAFPIYPELRAICFKTFGLAWTLRDVLLPLGGDIARAFVFGSVANGTDSAESDIDVMVIGSAELIKVYACADAAEKRLGRRVHINKHTPDEWASLRDDPIIQRILAQPIIEVAL
jgi:predicted nucleotidyltransferase